MWTSHGSLNPNSLQSETLHLIQDSIYYFLWYHQSLLILTKFSLLHFSLIGRLADAVSEIVKLHKWHVARLWQLTANRLCTHQCLCSTTSTARDTPSHHQSKEGRLYSCLHQTLTDFKNPFTETFSGKHAITASDLTFHLIMHYRVKNWGKIGEGIIEFWLLMNLIFFLRFQNIEQSFINTDWNLWL